VKPRAAPSSQCPSWVESDAGWKGVRAGLLGVRRTLLFLLCAAGVVPALLLGGFILLLFGVAQRFFIHNEALLQGFLLFMRCLPSLVMLYGLVQLSRLIQAPVKAVRGWAWVSFGTAVLTAALAIPLSLGLNGPRFVLLVAPSALAGVAFFCFLLELSRHIDARGSLAWQLLGALPSLVLLPSMALLPMLILASDLGPLTVVAFSFLLCSVLLLFKLQGLVHVLERPR